MKYNPFTIRYEFLSLNPLHTPHPEKKIIQKHVLHTHFINKGKRQFAFSNCGSHGIKHCDHLHGVTNKTTRLTQHETPSFTVKAACYTVQCQKTNKQNPPSKTAFEKQKTKMQ